MVGSDVQQRSTPVTVLLIAVSLTATLLLLAPQPAASFEADPLASEDRAWLAENGPLRVGWMHLPPVSYVTDGEVTGGWAVEALDLAALKAGIDLEPVVYADQAAMVAGLAAGEIDVIGVLGERPDVQEIGVGTEPLSWTPTVLVVGDSRPDARSVAELAGATVTTIPGSPLEADLPTIHPDLVYVPTASVPDGVAAVANGDIDAYFGPLAVIGAQLQRLGVRGPRPVGEPSKIILTRAWTLPDSPATSILSSARSLVTEQELAVIHVKWTGFDLTEFAPRGLPMWVVRALVGLAVAALVLGAFAFVLRRRVAAATAELRRHQEELEDLVAERTEDLQEANARLQSSNGALRSFAGAAAHDIRGPLASVAGFAEALRSGVLPEDMREMVLERIETASRRAAELVSDMLVAASNISGSDATGSLEAVDLEEWLGDLFAPDILSNGGTIDFTSSDPHIHADGAMVRRLLTNLVGNAMKYAGVAPTIRVRLDRQADEWTLTVSDDGPGVSAHDEPHIFDRGYQSDPGSGGEGLGLAGCRDLVREAGGELAYEPVLSGGARFTATFPVVTSVTSVPAKVPVGAAG